MKNQKGMTLVEILVAMGLMVMVVFCFTPFMLSSLQNVQVAGDQREDLYTQKGDIEEQIAEGIDAAEPDLKGVEIIFHQGTTEATGTAEGLYLTSAGEMLTSFIARDRASLDLSPSKVSENCSSSQKIAITCDFMEFVSEPDGTNKFKLMVSDGNDVWTKAEWVSFRIIDKNHAEMSANTAYRFDMRKMYRIYYGEDVYATLRITPSSLIAVGQNGAYYVYTSDKKWEKGTGFNASEGKLGDKTLNDAVWTGSQYVAAGEKGSWYYTEDGSGWQTVRLDEEDKFNKMYSDDGTTHVSGTSEVKLLGGLVGYKSFDSEITNPSEIESKINYFWETNNKENTAVTRAWINGTPQLMWANKEYTYKWFSGWKTIFGGVNNTRILVDNSVSDIASNNRKDESESERGEVVIVSDTSGQIWNYISTRTENSGWQNNGDGFNGEGTPREDKQPQASYNYTVIDGNKNVSMKVPITDIPADPENPQDLPPKPISRGGKYYVTIDGKDYELEKTNGEILCTYSYEEYYEGSRIAISGQMNSVEFGSTNQEDIWVAGGNIKYEVTDAFSKDVHSITYSLKNNGEWEVKSQLSNKNLPDGDAGGSPTNRNARILYRSADAYDDPGEWQVATVPSECPTINDIEFIAGKFYAVGDAGTILQSSNGKEWTPMTVTGSEKPNFKGIAGWGEEG